jgi:hypothetical protein
MSCVFQNIDPHPPLRPASVYPPHLLRGEDTLAAWRGVWGGKYFGRRKTQLCTLPISNPLWLALIALSLACLVAQMKFIWWKLKMSYHIAYPSWDCPAELLFAICFFFPSYGHQQLHSLDCQNFVHYNSLIFFT